MKKGIFYLVFAWLSCYVQTVRAQVFTVATGTDFSVKAGTVLSADGLDLTPSADFVITNNTLSRSIATISSPSFSYVKRVYQWSNTSNAFTGNLNLNYSDAELNSIAESALTLNVYNGTAWNAYGDNTRNTTTNYVQTVGLSNVQLKEMTLAAAILASWTGAVSTNWSTAANWSNNAVPNSSTSVSIPSVVTNQPVLSSNAAVGTLTLNGNIALNGHSLNLWGSVSGAGSFKGTAASTLVVNGTVGTLNFHPSYNNLGSLNLTAGSATLGNPLNVYNTLLPTNGTLNTGDFLTLKSTSIANSAIVGQVGGTVNGKVTVERYIPKGYRAWRDLAPQVFDAGSIYNNWQESGSYANAGYGLFITGTTTATNAHGVDATTGLDQTINSVKSAYSYTNGAWNAITNTKTTSLNPYAGYRLLVRGDRTFNLYTSPISSVGTNGWLLMYNATALRATGKLVTGNVVFSTTGVTNTVSGATYNSSSFGLNGSTDSSYSFIANPYVAPVDWKNIYDNGRAVNLRPSYYYLDPTIGSAGAYVAYNALTNVASNLATNARYIQAGQAIFVQNNASTSPTLTITEADKALATTKTSVFGTTSSSNIFSIHLLKQSATEWKKMDASVVVFDPHFSNEIGDEDAAKMTNTGENLALMNMGQLLSIEGRSTAKAGDQLPLSLQKLTSNAYALHIQAPTNQEDGLTAHLVDAFTKTTTTLKAGENQINFEADAANPATYAHRFIMVFKAATKTVATNAAINTALLQVYPNPLIGKTLTVRLGTSLAAGRYVVQLYNSEGGQVQSSIIHHSGTNAAQTITTEGKLAAGVYLLQVRNEAQKDQVYSTTIEVQ